jgi:hypothetical protein
VAGETITLRLSAGMLTTVASSSCTVDVEMYLTNRESLVSGSDLCATSATTINSLTFANKDFTHHPDQPEPRRPVGRADHGRVRGRGDGDGGQADHRLHRTPLRRQGLTDGRHQHRIQRRAVSARRRRPRPGATPQGVVPGHQADDEQGTTIVRKEVQKVLTVNTKYVKRAVTTQLEVRDPEPPIGIVRISRRRLPAIAYKPQRE